MVEKAEWPGVLRQVKLAGDVSTGQGWADLACALQDLKEKNSMAAAAAGRCRRGKEEEGPSSGGAAAAGGAAVQQKSHQPGMTDHMGSGDLSLQLGSSASYSTPSSSSNSRASADLYDAPNDLTSDDLSFLQDGEVRSMFKKITVNATLLNQAVESLGGGGKGMKALLGYIKLWLKEKKNTQFSIFQCMESLETPQPAPAETLQTPAEMTTPQAPAFPASSAAVPDYNVSPHGGHQTTTTPGVWCTEQVEANNNMSNNRLKRVSQPFESLHQSPEGAHLHHNSKICRIYGGSSADTAADVITTGFSSREAVSCSGTRTVGLTCPTYLPATAGTSIAARTDANLAAHDMLIHHNNINNNNNMMVVNQQPAAATASCLQKGLGFGLDADNNNSSSSCLSPAASKRAARKIRMARQRRSSSSMVSRSVSQGAISSLGCGSCTGLPGAGVISDDKHQGNSQIQPRIPVRVKGQVAWKTDLLHLLLQKDLQPSDVGNLGRIILPKDSEVHLPSLTLKEGVFISMEDFDTRMTWSFRYRYWPNNSSRMYLLENTGEFVKAHDLQGGDSLIIYKNRQGNFVIRGKKKDLCSKACAPISTTTAAAAATAVHPPNHNNNYAHSLARAPCDRGIIVKKAEEEKEEVHDGKSLHVNVPPPVADCCNYKQQEQHPEPFDIFLQDVMQGIQNEYEECGEVLQQLERFPSLDPDVSVDDILGLTFAAAGGSGGGGSGVSSVIPKVEPAS